MMPKGTKNMITTFKYNSNNKNDYDLAKHDVFKLIDKTLFYKEKTNDNIWAYNYSYLIWLEADEVCYELDNDEWSTLMMESTYVDAPTI
jgi:hypothetical protein